MNKRDMEAALDCFDNDSIYEVEDPVSVNTFRGKEALREHLINNASSLPLTCQIILDNLAIDTIRCTFLVKWHLEVNMVWECPIFEGVRCVKWIARWDF
mmetsp:Transcript_24887/g.30591  ORF Transcript_24887/g.30591 Transcript_24887/m.30591 type:complete len:99 (+) Transcript_24887:476-772(+)